MPGSRDSRIGASAAARPGRYPETPRSLLDDDQAVTVRCGECRADDWAKGGPGRAPLIGELRAHPDRDVIVLWERHRHGRQHRPHQAAIFDSVATPHDGPRPIDWLPQYAHQGLRVKCRHGHHLRISAERFERILDQPLGRDNTLYLPGT